MAASRLKDFLTKPKGKERFLGGRFKPGDLVMFVFWSTRDHEFTVKVSYVTGVVLRGGDLYYQLKSRSHPEVSEHRVFENIGEAHEWLQKLP